MMQFMILSIEKINILQNNLKTMKSYEGKHNDYLYKIACFLQQKD